MAAADINIAMHQAKMLFVRQTQMYVLVAVTIHCIFVILLYNLIATLGGSYYRHPEWAILYVLIEIVLLSLVVFRIGSTMSVGFALLAALLLLSALPFSFMALFPLKKFQQEREHIDYKRRVTLLPVLRSSNVQNLALEGRILLVSWVGVIIGPIIMSAGLWKLHSLGVGILGFIIFCVGIVTFNRTNISIRGEKITITRTGLGGSLRRSNYTVIHRIEVTDIDYRHGKLRIKYSFVGSGVEREVLFAGSEKNCRRIIDALSGHNEENQYDIQSMEFQEGYASPAANRLTGVVPEPVVENQNSATSSIGVRTLISAIRSNQIALIQQLVEAGVDPNSQDQLGRKPLQVAQQTGNKYVIDFLKRVGAR